MIGSTTLRRGLRVAARVGRAEVHPEDAVALAFGRPVARKSPVPEYAADGPVVVLSPHLDDAVFGCWSALTEPRDVQVFNVFAGVPRDGFLSHGDRLAGATESSTRMRDRREEDAKALQHAGRSSRNLDLLAYGYRRGAPSVAAIARALAEQVTNVSRVVAPAGIGGHPDHHIVRRVALRWAKAGVPASFFADMPYAVTYGWPGWVDGSTPSPFVDVDEFWRGFVDRELALEEERATVVQLDDAAIDAKLRAMRAYTSQYPWLSGGSRDWLADPRILRYEVLWTLRPAQSAARALS
jgi:LmbE family N-acetylglucosaminyl deacetylase